MPTFLLLGEDNVDKELVLAFNSRLAARGREKAGKR